MKICIRSGKRRAMDMKSVFVAGLLTVGHAISIVSPVLADDPCSGGAAIPTGQVMTVLSGGPTSTECVYPDGSKMSFANAGEGGPVVLNNSTNLTYQNQSIFGDPTPRDTPYPAALYMYASPFHVAERVVAGQGLVWNGYEYVIGTVWYDESYWSTEVFTAYLIDYFSQDLELTNSDDITIEPGDENDTFSPIEVWGSVNAVSVTNSGDLTASGNFVNGIRAVSGLGLDPFRWNVADGIAWPGGAVTVTNSGDIHIIGFGTKGIHAEALGGGITIQNSGDITMDGESSNAILADQWSTNNSEFTETKTITITNTGALSTTGDNSRGIFAEMRPAGTIEIDNNGAIAIAGEDAIGIFAVSGEDSDSEGGDAATVEIKGNGTISATGIAAIGIEANSRYGSALVDYDGSVTANGTYGSGIVATSESGSATVKANSNVQATGQGGKGIVVGAGSDPVVGSDVMTNAGDLTVEVGTGVSVTGGQDADVDHQVAKIGTGVLFLGGATNTLRNHGIISAASGTAVLAYEGPLTVSEFDEEADEEIEYTVQFQAGPLNIENFDTITGDIISGAGNDTIQNDGTISGDVDLGGGANSILNTGRFNSNSDIKLGSGNSFTNQDTFSAGGDAAIKKTVLVGNFVQTSAGTMIVNVNPDAMTSDLLEVTGRAALAGSVLPIIPLSTVIESQYTILTAAGGIETGSTLSVDDTAAYDFEVVLNANSATLTARRTVETEELVTEAASTATGTNASNISAMAKAIAGGDTGETNGLTPVVNAILLSPDNPQGLASGLLTLLPQNPGTQANNTSGANTAFSNTMLSCTERDGNMKWTREGQCYYAKFGARRLERDASSGDTGVEETGYEFMGGAQGALWDQLRLGFAVGYEELSSNSFNSAQRLGDSDADRVSLGFVLKNQWGAWNAYWNIAGSFANYDHRRYVSLGPLQETARGDQDVWSGASRLRISHTSDFGPWYWKPMIDLAATYIHADGYTETGASAALTLDSSKNWLLSVTPGFEVGTEIASADGTILRPYLRAGIIMFDDDEVSVTTNFAAAPAGVAPFLVKGKYEQYAADIESGLHILTRTGINLKLNYEGRYAKDGEQHAGGVKFSAPY